GCTSRCCCARSTLAATRSCSPTRCSPDCRRLCSSISATSAVSSSSGSRTAGAARSKGWCRSRPPQPSRPPWPERPRLGDELDADQVLGTQLARRLEREHGLQRRDRHRELVVVGL